MAEEKNQVEQQGAQEENQQKAVADTAKRDKKPAKVEISKNCAECKKPVRKIRYYRNMMFFCNRKCWNSFKTKEAAKKKSESEKQEQPQA